MASLVIHLAVANEVNKVLKKDNNYLLIGAVAPDLSKQIGETKVYSHFLDNPDTNIPNIERFLNKYQCHLDDSFILGYFIHLYTDYLWFKYFMQEIYDNNILTKLDGEIIKCDKDQMMYYLYNDYTNLNKVLLESYNLDIEFFNNPLPVFNVPIDEIRMDKLDIILKKCLTIIDESKIGEKYIFDVNNINKFINTSIELILAKINEIINNERN